VSEAQGTVTTVVTGAASTVIVPAHWHMHVAPMPIAGTPSIRTPVGGAHGAGMIGTHGAGPSAACTAGLAGLTHIPNDGTFAIGRWSLIVATGTPVGAISTCGGPGAIVSADGAAPIAHMSCEPVPASGGMSWTVADRAMPRNGRGHAARRRAGIPPRVGASP